MARTYITRQDDVIDLICWRAYRRTSGPTEIVLAANPHLRDQPVRLPAGLTILLPDLEPTPTRIIRIWD